MKPIVHENYGGEDIRLFGDSSQIIKVEKNPILKEMVGDDIITSDGTTLLGSADKAGCAAIMTLADLLLRNPHMCSGGHNFHSKHEFNSRRGLEKTTETLSDLVQIFAEKR